MIKVQIVSSTPEPEVTCAAAARACLKDEEYGVIKDDLKSRDVDRILATVIAKGHHSVLEHATFTFAISGVSRVLTHQLVRHRIASYSQLSQQRSDYSQAEYVVPPEVRKDSYLAQEYEATMKRCLELYRDMLARNVPPGSARYVLPSGFGTRIITTLNARSLYNLLALRMCAAEEWEFRQVATFMHRELMRVAPRLFRFAGTSCETDMVCPEGDIGYDCGRRLRTGANVLNTKDSISQLVGSSSQATEG